MPLKEYAPLQIPKPIPLEVNPAIAIAGGEVCYGWCNKKLGSEWAGGYKASYKQNKLAGTKGAFINRTEIWYFFIIFMYLLFML